MEQEDRRERLSFGDVVIITYVLYLVGMGLILYLDQ
jgi:hypothetical protein